MRRLLSLLVLAVVAAVVGCSGPAAVTGVERFTQGGVSMEPTIKAGQVITARRVGSDYTPKRGDIVVFHAPSDQWGPDTTLPFLKRVIAVGGERVSCCDVEGRVYINGTGLDERYVTKNSPLDTPPGSDVCASRRFDEVKVPEGSIFVMGDNRAASNDSRCAGTIPVTSVIAVVTG